MGKEDVYKVRREKNNISSRKHRLRKTIFYDNLRTNNELLKKEIEKLRKELAVKEGEIEKLKEELEIHISTGQQIWLTLPMPLSVEDDISNPPFHQLFE